MAKELGTTLPPEVLAAFDGTHLEAHLGDGYVLTTVDADGKPRICMLSAGEILALDGRRYRLALWPGTHTGQNLSRGSPAALCFVAPGTVLYIHGVGSALGSASGARTERFEVVVDAVRSDAHPGMPVTGGIRFEVGGLDEGAVLDMWRMQIDALRD